MNINCISFEKQCTHFSLQTEFLQLMLCTGKCKTMKKFQTSVVLSFIMFYIVRSFMIKTIVKPVLDNICLERTDLVKKILALSHKPTSRKVLKI
jgi:hypothetical protein